MLVDRPFLDKFKYKTTYHKNNEEYIQQILYEITNVLSSRLREEEKIINNPFSYGIKDITSIDLSKESIEKFKVNCEKQVKLLEPRVSEFEIEEVEVDNNNQRLKLYINCVIKKTKEKVQHTMLLLF